MNVSLCGACGKMGAYVSSLAEENGAKIVCGVDRFPKESPFPVYPSFDLVTERADVVIDFSGNEDVESRLAFCKNRGVNIVLASTGFSENDQKIIQRYAKSIAIFQTGNLSLGINLLQLLVKKAAQILGDGFDAEIIERHHNQKKDAPSGTALMLAKSIQEGSENSKTFVYGREGNVGAREKSEIGIHAVRGGTIVGEHEVCFAGEDEIITLSHSARSRKVFANGALKAAKWLIGKQAGIYDMSDFFAQI